MNNAGVIVIELAALSAFFASMFTNTTMAYAFLTAGPSAEVVAGAQRAIIPRPTAWSRRQHQLHHKVKMAITGTGSKAGDWHADLYANNAAFVPELGKKALDMLAPKSGERILDIGCGDGALTIELQRRGCRVVGIDFAPDMVAAARERGVEAYVMDACSIDAPFLLSKINGLEDHTNASSNNNPAEKTEPSSPACVGGILKPQEEGDQGSAVPVVPDLEKPAAFDAVFTNAALHWVTSLDAAIEGAKQVLRPGGRFVGELGGHGNIAAIRVAMHTTLRRRGIDPIEVDPWYFPTLGEFRLLLEAAGFVVEDIALVPRPTILPRNTGMRGLLSICSQAFLNALPTEDSSSKNDNGDVTELDKNYMTKAHAEVIDEAVACLQPAMCDGTGLWTVEYVRLRFKAHLPLVSEGVDHTLFAAVEKARPYSRHERCQKGAGGGG